MFGGDNWDNNAWTLNLTSYTWTKLATSATKPSTRSHYSPIVYNAQMVMYGGLKDDEVLKNDAWTLDLTVAPTTTTTG